jgi:acyl-CoA thioester hydrolase
MEFSKLPVTYRKTIPPEYLDTLEHMNVMWYTHLFDQATFGFFDIFGFGLEYHTKSGNGSFALEQHTRYLSEVRVGQSITVRTRALGRSSKRFHFMHFMLKDEGDILAATTELVGTHVDMTIRRSSPLPAQISAGFDAVLTEHQQLDWPAPICGSMAP